MRDDVKQRATRLLDASGVLGLPRRLLPAWPRILMYHQFCAGDETRGDGTSANVLRRQLHHITQHYRPMRLHDMAAALAVGEPIPPKSIALTVDDGHASFLRYAVPLLQEFHVPATLFVVTDLPSEDGWLWTDRFLYLCEAATRQVFPGHVARLAALTGLKTTAPLERDERLAELARQAGVDIPAQPPPPYDLLSWEQLRGLSASPLIDIGSHTRSHATLCSIDQEQAHEEIFGSRRELENRLGVPVTTFCYPNGSPRDYHREHLKMVEEAGYVCATAAHFGCVREATNRLALPRIACHPGDISRFRKAVDGFDFLLRRWRGEGCF